MTAVARLACGSHEAMVTAITAMPSITCPAPAVAAMAAVPATGTPRRNIQIPPGMPRPYAHDDTVATTIRAT